LSLEELLLKRSFLKKMVNEAKKDNFLNALKTFATPTERDENSGFDETECKRTLMEYLDFVSRTGRPLFAWSIIQPFFIHECERSISEAIRNLQVPSNGREQLNAYRRRIIQRMQDFDGVPFTIQRICELLLNPARNYKRVDKFLRALEKCVYVVTTVDANGEREIDRDHIVLNGSSNTGDAEREEETENGDLAAQVEGHRPTTPFSSSTGSSMPSIEALWQSTSVPGRVYSLGSPSEGSDMYFNQDGPTPGYFRENRVSFPMDNPTYGLPSSGTYMPARQPSPELYSLPSVESVFAGRDGERAANDLTGPSNAAQNLNNNNNKNNNSVEISLSVNSENSLGDDEIQEPACKKPPPL
ncbi:Serine/threonine-protein phosphatase 4 regulatory subunit 2, partial [Trichinella britovi]